MLIRELSTLLKANLPLLTALEILAKQHPAKIKLLFMALKKDISDGASLSQALRKYPKHFEAITTAIIKAGEEAAALPQVLENIAVYQEKIALLKQRFKKAIFYPVTVLCVALLITLGLLIFIVPQFETLFDSMGAQLPWMTRAVLSLTRIVTTYGLPAAALILLCFIIITVSRKYILSINNIISSIFSYFLYMPVVGKISQKIMFSRFAHTLAILLHASIPLTEALKIASQIITHKKYQQAIMISREHIIKGDAFSNALQKSHIFPFVFMQFVHIGEQSGSLAAMLTNLGERYEMETDQTLHTLTLLLEPAIMLILGLLIGGLVIAMYLPVFQLGKIV